MMKKVLVLMLMAVAAQWVAAQDLREGRSGNLCVRAEYDQTAENNFRYYLIRGGGNCFVFYDFNETLQGFYSGGSSNWVITRQLPFGRDTLIGAYAAEHGVAFAFPGSRADSVPVYLHQVLVGWAEGTQPVPFDPNGSRDPYHIRLYEVDSTLMPRTPNRPIVEQRFRLQNFVHRFARDEDKTYLIQYPGALPAEEYWLPTDSTRNYSVVVEVRSQVSDDLLNLKYISHACVPDNWLPWGGIVHFRDTVNHQIEAATLFPDAFGFRQAYLRGELLFYLHTPLIIPVVVPIRKPTDRPVGLGRVGGLALESPFPNPAADFTHLRFTLERPSDVRLLVLDAAGRRVAEHQIPAPAGPTVHQLDTRDWPCGAYTVLVQSSLGQMGTRLLIDR